MSANVILVDIDHTISDASRRDHMIAEGDWDAYHAAAADDQPLASIVTLIGGLVRSEDFRVIGLTARPEKWAQLTQAWCVQHNIPLWSIIFRPDADRRPAAQVKIAAALDYFGSEAELKACTLVVIDDRDDVLAPFRALGIATLQVSVAK